MSSYPYTAKEAHYYALERQKRKHKPKLVTQEFLREWIVKMLHADWSPEQIAGRLKKHPPPELNGVSVCMETIYQYIYNEEQGEPSEINTKSEFGHWESDSLVGKGHKGGASVQYEQKIQLVRLHKLTGFTAEETKEAMSRTIVNLPEGCVNSITLDNGTETAEHVNLRYDHKVKNTIVTLTSHSRKVGWRTSMG